MANRNGLGPDNLGPMTGRGLGNCEGAAKTVARGMGLGRGAGNGAGRGLGRGMARGFGKGMNGRGACGRGFRRGGGYGYRFAPGRQVEPAESLEDYKAFLEAELQGVNAELEGNE